jgi:hypothetical protein
VAVAAEAQPMTPTSRHASLTRTRKPGRFVDRAVPSPIKAQPPQRSDKTSQESLRGAGMERCGSPQAPQHLHPRRETVEPVASEEVEVPVVDEEDPAPHREQREPMQMQLLQLRPSPCSTDSVRRVPQ